MAVFTLLEYLPPFSLLLGVVMKKQRQLPQAIQKLVTAAERSRDLGSYDQAIAMVTKMLVTLDFKERNYVKRHVKLQARWVLGMKNYWSELHDRLLIAREGLVTRIKIEAIRFDD